MTIRQPIITVAGHVDHGKCVAGDTLLTLNTGEIKKAKEIFYEYYEEDKAKKIDDGIFQDISKKGVEISSFDGKNIVRKNISHIWRREAESLIEVKIASGDIIQTTPEHLFLIFNDGISEKRADKLSKEDYIIFPKYIKTADTPIKNIIIKRLKQLDNFVCFTNKKFDLVFNKLSNQIHKNIEKKLSLKNLSENIRQKRFRIKDIFLIGYYLGINDDEVYSTIDSIKNSSNKWRAGHTSNEVSLPSIENPEELGYILGCIAGDGHLTKTNAILNNNDKEVQNAYSQSLKKIFNLETKIQIGHTCQIVRNSGGMTFVRILSEIFDIPIGNKSGRIIVPEIAKSNKEVFKGFFTGLFDTDGYVSKHNNCIEITSKSKDIIKENSILLLNFGILSTIYAKNGFYNLRISNKEYLKAFLENISPRLTRKTERIIKAYEKAQASRIFDIVPIDKKQLKDIKIHGKKNRAVPYFNKYLKSQNITRDFILKVLEKIKENNEFSDSLTKLMHSDIRLVKVVAKNIIKNKEKYVYDFTVPDTKNFIAERFIIHNTSLLDCFRDSLVQEKEAGGITQKISFTKYPIDQIKKVCPLIDKSNIELKIPGFLFIDTPGHAAFTNLRQRGGSLADIVILVVDIKEGIKPQTAEVIQILKANKTPFVIALNKIDKLGGWRKTESIKKSLENLPTHAKEEFLVALGTFQSSLQSHGFDGELFYEISDFTKKVAIVPCSARTKEGISEILFVLCGLSQRFLTDKLTLSKEAKGILLEVKKERSMETAEAILYDGILKEGDQIGIATLDGHLIITKIRCLEEIQPLSFKFKSVKEVSATTGIRLQLTNKEEILSGMPFQKIDNNEKEIKEKFSKEFKNTLSVEKEGIIIKADSLGSLEALLTLLKQANISVVKASIGNIGKSEIIAAKANIEINPLNAIILGFNVEKEPELQYDKDNIKILTNQVVYKLIEELQDWRKFKQSQIEKERLMQLSQICKLEILHKFQFRNSNPAIFGVKILAGKLKKNMQLIDETDEQIARVKALQEEKTSVEEASEGKELAISLPGTNFERQLADKKYLYNQLSESQFKAFKKNKDLLSETEIKALMEIAEIKRKKKSEWGK